MLASTTYSLIHTESKMSQAETIPPHTRKDSRPKDLKNQTLQEIIDRNREKNRTIWKAQAEAQNSSGESKVKESSREQAIKIGEVVWEGLLSDDDELKGTSFMEWLE